MTPTILSEDTVATLRQLHPFLSNLFFSPIFDNELKHIFVVDKILFAQALTIIFHFFWVGFLGCFIPKDPSLRFLDLFQVATHVAHGDIPKLVALMLGISRLLAMAKNTNSLHSIVVGKVFIWLISRSIAL